MNMNRKKKRSITLSRKVINKESIELKEQLQKNKEMFVFN